MGNSACSCGQAGIEFTCGDATGHWQDGIVVEVEETIQQAADAIKEGVMEAADVKEQATQIVDASGQAVELVAEGVAELAEHVEEAADVVKEQATQIAETSGQAVELVAEQVAELAEDVEEQAEEVQKAAGQVAEAAEKVTSTIDALMDAAVAAVTGTTIVDFADEKGAEQQVTFKTRKLGFELGLSGGGFCRAKGQARVAAKQVTRGGQAEALGVKRGWRAKSVNGVDVTGLEQAKKLLADLALKLPEA